MTLHPSSKSVLPKPVTVTGNPGKVTADKTAPAIRPTDGKKAIPQPGLSNSARLSMPAEEYVADFELPEFGADSRIRPAEF